MQERMDIAQSIQNTFAQAGIELELKVMDGKEVLQDYRARNHQVTLQTWGPDYPDPQTNASTFALNENNSDEAKLTGSLAWRNAYDPGPLNAMVEAAVQERDTAKRAAMYEEMQKIHRETSPFVLMYQQTYQTAMRANVNGFSTGGSTDSAAYWQVTK
ncbi:ABC transporter substrate-binding protein [Phaeovulum sp.]|uniref:ABC transporter substrate-binding protein n=1 Tax=Phaeovulum sp. TaxID=2934796 RepID=UPI0039E5F2D0